MNTIPFQSHLNSISIHSSFQTRHHHIIKVHFISFYHYFHLFLYVLPQTTAEYAFTSIEKKIFHLQNYYFFLQQEKSNWDFFWGSKRKTQKINDYIEPYFQVYVSSRKKIKEKSLPYVVIFRDFSFFFISFSLSLSLTLL